MGDFKSRITFDEVQNLKPTPLRGTVLILVPDKAILEGDDVFVVDKSGVISILMIDKHGFEVVKDSRAKSGEGDTIASLGGFISDRV